MTLGQLAQNNTTDPTKAMVDQRRKIKGSEEEILKKIGHAEAVNKGLVKAPMGTMGRIHDREFVKNARDPAKFNAMNYAKEYGKQMQ